MSWKLRTTIAAATAALCLAASAASAVTLNFYTVPPGNSVNDVSSQITVDVTDGGTGALFDFNVLAGLNSGATISEIYFSDLAGILMAPIQLITQVGTLFEVGDAQPPDLPGGNNAMPPFTVTSGLLAQASGNNSTGLSFGEDLVLKINYASGFNFDDLLANLNDGDFRLAMHVTSLTNGASDSVVNTPPIPVPASALLLATALAAFGFARRRKAA